MDREITVKYTPEIIKFAVWRFWTRSLGLSVFIAFIVLCIALIIVLLSGDRSWLTGFIGAGVLACVAMLISSYFVSLNRSMSKFRQMEIPIGKFRFTDKIVGIESDMGKMELPWKMIEKIWKYPSVWLVFVAEQSYITLPTTDIDKELQQFITLKVAEAKMVNQSQ